MFYVWEFEIVKDDKYYDAFPVAPLEGGTFGETFDDAVVSAADWLACMVDESLMNGAELPEMRFGAEPEHEDGKVIAIAVTRELGGIPAMTASEAARELGVSPARIDQLSKAGLLDSWKDGTRRMVSKASVDARKEDAPKAGRPKTVAV